METEVEEIENNNDIPLENENKKEEKVIHFFILFIISLRFRINRNYRNKNNNKF